MSKRQWVYVGERAGNKPPAEEKAAIAAACAKFIAEVLKPRFLPAICPTEFNYPIDIYGKWHGNKYRFIELFRSDRPDATVIEFEAPFARLGYVGRDRFDLSYHRHTGQWWCLYRSVSLIESLTLIEEQGHFHPVG